MPLRRALAALFAAAIASVTAVAHADKPKLVTVTRLWGIGELRVTTQGHTRVLERFDSPQHVESKEVSPDGRWALLWHYGPKPPLRITVYEIATGKRVSRFSPGVGGELHFTPAGNLVHDWGCGTNCHGYALYDVRGRTKLDGVASGLDISPRRRFLVTSPSLFASDEPVVVYDLDRAIKAFESDAAYNGAWILDEARWNEARGEILLRLSDWSPKTRRLSVKVDPNGRGTGRLPDGPPERRSVQQ